jgi:hypothetical protein
MTNAHFVQSPLDNNTVMLISPTAHWPGMTCSHCTMPTCRHSLAQTAVCDCPECEVNTMVLDVNSKPKWKVCRAGQCSSWFRAAGLQCAWRQSGALFNCAQCLVVK